MSRKATPRTAILSYVDSSATGRHADRERTVRCNHERYAARNNATYISPETGSAEWQVLHLTGHGTRAKTAQLILHMPTYDYLLWVDADVVFNNRRLPLSRWIRQLDDANADILVAPIDHSAVAGSYAPFNAGAMLVRSSGWAARFFAETVPFLRARSLSEQFQDQPILHKLYRENWRGARRKILVHPRRHEFQAFTKLREVDVDSWLVHDTSCESMTSCGLAQYVEPECAALQPELARPAREAPALLPAVDPIDILYPALYLLVLVAAFCVGRWSAQVSCRRGRNGWPTGSRCCSGKLPLPPCVEPVAVHVRRHEDRPVASAGDNEPLDAASVSERCVQ